MNMQDQRVTIHLAKENMKFSAGHFTIFGAGDRERLHGHNFTVEVLLTADMLGNGMCFDYGIYKSRVVSLCRELNEWFILPMFSTYLSIEENGEHLTAVFGDERIPFLKKDVLLLPIVNATIEEFAGYLLGRMIEDPDAIAAHRIAAIEVRVTSGPGQSAAKSVVFAGH